MALTADGTLLLAANNADDPPFATLLAANGDMTASNTHVISRITVDPAIVPPGLGLSHAGHQGEERAFCRHRRGYGLG